MDKTPLFLVGAAVLLVVGLVLLAPTGGNQSNEETGLIQCINHAAVKMHIHSKLSILMDGAPIDIPADIGIDPACMHPIHTHSAGGQIHVEYPQQRDFELGEFFKLWNQPFSRSQIMDRSADDAHTLSMTVDGEPSGDFEQLVMRDEQEIVIRYDRLPQ